MSLIEIYEWLDPEYKPTVPDTPLAQERHTLQFARSSLRIRNGLAQRPIFVYIIDAGMFDTPTLYELINEFPDVLFVSPLQVDDLFYYKFACTPQGDVYTLRLTIEETFEVMKRMEASGIPQIVP